MMRGMGSKNEHITLWILEQERKENQAHRLKEMTRKTQRYTVEGRNHCSKCKKTFNEPKMVPVCPHCMNRIEEKVKTGCQYWFGYLSQKEKTESVPQECVECEKVLECMLNQKNSASAASEIKKWY
jgi:hypothetical protein